jgi:hypothetical protein
MFNAMIQKGEANMELMLTLALFFVILGIAIFMGIFNDIIANTMKIRKVRKKWEE